MIRTRGEDAMTDKKSVKDSIAELKDNLGTIGLFMVAEVRVFLRKSWSGSREEFMTALDHVARSLKQSGKLAAGDVERAVEDIKKNWDVLDAQRNLEWETFLNDVKSRLSLIGDVSRETFDQAVDFAQKRLVSHWEAAGRPGEDLLASVQSYSEKMGGVLKDQAGLFRDAITETGKKIDRALQAALDELRKKE